MEFLSLDSSQLSNNNRVNHNQAIEIAVDAHATRLIQDHSPPEACVDSSLGPYITSILRGALTNNNNIHLSYLAEYDSLIELMESQCQMELNVAKEVIAEIALAVKTNGIQTDNKNRYNNNGSSQSSPDKRSRSKSLGAEPAQELDVNFLGKILQETMSPSVSAHDQQIGFQLTRTSTLDEPLPQSLSNDEFHSFHESFSSPTSHGYMDNGFMNNNNSSALLSRDRSYRKQRHVSFDETYTATFHNGPQAYAHDNGPQCREPYSFGSSFTPTNSQNWYMPNSPAESGVDEAQACLGNLGFLDLEDEDDSDVGDDLAEDDCVATNPCGSSEWGQANQDTNMLMEQKDCGAADQDGSNMLVEKNGSVMASGSTVSSLEVINSELAQCHPVSGFPDLAPAENSQESTNVTTDKPPLNPRRSKKRSSKKEADELVAALFVSNSRPRSNSLPLSVSSGVPSFSFTNQRVASSKSSTSLATSETSATTNSTQNSAVIQSTTEILLTMNYHLGHEAASLASQLSYGDLNLAQYLIEAARSITAGNGFSSYHRRRRICRHELQGTCYRHDCPYSHDIAGVTCLFWLKGRCHHADGSSCRFMHGFAESLLEGVNEDYLKEQQAKKEQSRHMEEEKRNQPVLVQTTNLLQHNSWAGDRNEWTPDKKEWGADNSRASPVFGTGLWSSKSPSVTNR